MASAFRIKFTDPHGNWWTMPILNWIDASMLVSMQRDLGNRADIFVSNAGLAREVNRYFVGAFAEQQRTKEVRLGEMMVGCTCGKCFHAATAIVRVPQSRPDAHEADEGCCGVGEPIDFKVTAVDDEPRELRGPTADDVAQHTPHVMAFDHGGGRAKRHQSPGDAQATPPPASVGWIERLFEWITGAPQGSEVRK